MSDAYLNQRIKYLEEKVVKLENRLHHLEQSTMLHIQQTEKPVRPRYDSTNDPDVGPSFE